MNQTVPDNFWIFVLLVAWTLPWKGVALWKAGKRHDTWWFVALLIVNTLGILDILYIFIWNKRAHSTIVQ